MQVGGVLLLILKGEVHFAGDPHKGGRDGGAWRPSAIGELCTSATLGPGDAIAVGKPSEEAILACLHANYEGGGGGGGDDVGVGQDGAGSGGGRLKLLGGSYHRCAALALTEVEVVMIPTAELATVAADAPPLLGGQQGIRALLQGTAWASELARPEFDALAFALKPREALAGDVLVEEGKAAPALHLVISGEVRVTRTAADGREVLIFKAASGDILGERSLATSEPAIATATADGPCVTLALTREAYHSAMPARGARQAAIEQRRFASQLLGGVGTDAAVPPSAACNQHAITCNQHANADAAALPSAADTPVFGSLSELEPLSVVGAGAFARVAVVRHRPSGRLVALKKMTRASISSKQFRRQIMNERFVMGDVAHPLIATLHATFKSAESLFCVIEPLLGGELFEHMRRLNTLPEAHATFYAACVTSAFEHLHARHIAYRDLKPENLMLTGDGYVKVVDFGLARRLLGKTYTLCGTPE